MRPFRVLLRELRRTLRSMGLLPKRWREPATSLGDNPDDPESWVSLDYIHEQVLSQLAVQGDIWETVDGQLRMILGVIGIVFAAAAAFQRTPAGAAPLPFVVGAAVVGALLLFLAAATFAGLSYWPTDFDRPPEPQQLRDRYLTSAPREVQLAVIDTVLLAYTENAKVIARKTLAFNRAFVLTAAATILLGVALALQVACQTAAPDLAWWPFPRSGC